MKVAVIDIMLRGETIAQKFQSAARYGFDGIEVFVGADSDLRKVEQDVRQSARSTGLEVLQIAVLREAWAAPAVDRKSLQGKIAAQKTCIELSAKVGGHFSQVVPEYTAQFVSMAGMNQPSKEEIGYFMEFLAETADFASRFGLLLVVDSINRYETRYCRRLEDVVAVCNELQKPNVKTIADFFHMNLEEPNIEEALEAAGKCIGHVHLADSNRSLPGGGHIDFSAGFRALKKVGYDGYMTFEVQADFVRDPERQFPEAIEYVRRLWNSD